jgi:hypothetical protein
MTTNREHATMTTQGQAGRRMTSINERTTSTPPGGVTGFLPIVAVAGELGISEIAVSRLIARQRIKAVRLGMDGPWRISSEELSRYIGIGAPDLTPPAFRADWFDHNPTAAGKGQFAVLMDAAIRDAQPDHAPADDRPTWQQADVMTVELSITAAMIALAKKPIDRTFCPPSLRTQQVFPDVATAFFTEALRDVVGAMLRGPKARLEALYASPEEYNQIVTAATDKLKTRCFTRQAVLPTAEGSDIKTAPSKDGSGLKSVLFTVPFKGFLDSARLLAIWQAAF